MDSRPDPVRCKSVRSWRARGGQACLVGVLLLGTVAMRSPAAPPPLLDAWFTALDLRPSNPNATVLADFDRDGALDLAVAADSAVHVFQNQGDGAYVETERRFLLGRLSSIAAGDWNGDGQLDLAVGRFGAMDPFVSFLQGRGDGTFQEGQTLWVGWSPFCLRFGDLDMDGRDDLVVDTENGLEVLYGAGVRKSTVPWNETAEIPPPSFTIADLDRDGAPELVRLTRTSVAVYTCRSGEIELLDSVGFTLGFVRRGTVEAADVDGDGWLDLIGALGDTVAVFPNDRGDFHDIEFTRQSAERIRVADFDGDGAGDLVIVTLYGGRLVVARGHGDGTFAAPLTVYTGDFHSMEIGDIDRDGTQDLVGCEHGKSRVLIFSGRGDATFGRTTHITTDPRPTALLAADLNADGKDDLAVAEATTGCLALYTELDDARFEPTSRLEVGTSPSHAAAGDLDGDEDDDIAVTDSTQNEVLLLRSDGSGGFAAWQRIPTLTTPTFVVIAELDGDGSGDLVVASRSANEIRIHPSRAEPAWSVFETYATGTAPSGVAVLRRQSDAPPDLVVANEADATVSVFRNDGHGRFSRDNDVGTAAKPRSVSATDLDGDGNADLVVGDADGSIFYGTASGAFELVAAAPQCNGPGAVVTTDLNADGRTDIAIAVAGADIVRVALARADRAFEPHVGFGAGRQPFALVAGDWNADSRADLAATSAAARWVALLYNARPVVTGVTDLRIWSEPGAVHLSWMLPDQGVRELGSIRVEKALGEAGSYALWDELSLPQTSMVITDRDVQAGVTYWYRLHLDYRVGADHVTESVHVQVPWVTAFRQPVELENGRVVVRYTLAEPAQVRLRVFDVRGRLVQVLEDGPQGAGEHQSVWVRSTRAARSAPRGIYLVQWQAGQSAATRKIVALHP